MKFILSILYLFYAVSLCFNLSTNTFDLSKKYKLRKPLLSTLSSRLELPNRTSSKNIFHNANSYYNKHKIVGNMTNDIDKIYLSYNNKYSLIFYKNGFIEENFNKTLKIRPEQDILEIKMVSMKYFLKIYNDLHNITK